MPKPETIDVNIGYDVTVLMILNLRAFAEKQDDPDDRKFLFMAADHMVELSKK